MELNVLDHRLRVASIQKEFISSLMHPLIRIGILLKTGCNFFSLTETSDDYTLVMDDTAYQEIPDALMKSEQMQVAEDTWVPLTVTAGAFSSASGIAKIAQSLIIPLARHQISIYSLSTYQSDYILVRSKDVSQVLNCLSSGRGSEGNVPILGQDLTVPLDLKQTLQNSESFIQHQVTYPGNKLRVTSLSQDSLNSIGLAVVEQLFYPKNKIQEDTEVFFSFTLVEGNVTMVMDDHTFNTFPSAAIYADNDSWRMVKIGGMEDDLGFSECGIVAQVLSAITEVDISEYYISTYHSDHTLVPESSLKEVIELIEKNRPHGS